MEDRELPSGPRGYAIEKENRSLLAEQGMDTTKMLRLAEANAPKFNVDVDPMTLFAPLNQGGQGACQGHALAMMFVICYYLMTGRIESFSRAAGYYLSQRKDNISGDR